MTDRGVGVTDQASGAGVADVRARERVISSVTYDEQYVIPIRERVLTGVYLYSFLGTVQAAAQTANTGGFLWVHNPSSTISLALRRSNFVSAPAAATAFATSPRIAWRRFTSTGTPSGAALTPSKGATAHAAATHSVRSAITGLTVTEVADVFAYMPIVVVTAVGATPPAYQDWNPEDDGMIILAQNEGLVLRQLDAGTASDTRRFAVNFAVEEFTLP